MKIRYAASVPRLDGQYELHFPMVVGSRYSNGKNGIEVPELNKALPSGATHNDPRLSSAPLPNPGARVSLRASTCARACQSSPWPRPPTGSRSTAPRPTSVR